MLWHASSFLTLLEILHLVSQIHHLAFLYASFILFRAEGGRGAGVNPSCREVTCGVQPGQVLKSSQINQMFRTIGLASSPSKDMLQMCFCRTHTHTHVCLYVRAATNDYFNSRVVIDY